MHQIQKKQDSIENSSEYDLIKSLVEQQEHSLIAMFMDDDDAGQDFTADIELTKRSDTDLLQLNVTDASL